MSYDQGTGLWSVLWGNQFDIAAGEGYGLFAGGGIEIDLPLRLVGMVPDGPLSVTVGNDSYSVNEHWLCYSKPEPTTLENCGLRQSLVSGWNAYNAVRLRPLGSAVWTTYAYDAGNGWWENVLNPDVAVDPPLACGEALVFIRVVGVNDEQWVQPNWYFHPPNRW